MINVSRVLVSPMFRQTFEVFRSTGHFDLGGWVEEPQSPPSFPVSGIAWPSSAREIQQVPEGDRVLGMHTFATAEQIYTTRIAGATEAGTSDQIEWKGEKYRIIQCLPFSDYGYYLSVGARMQGA